MNIFKESMAPKEVKAALNVLDEAEDKFNSRYFKIVRDEIEKIILSRQNEVVKLIQGGASPREWIYSVIGNIAGDHVESGRYHVYRGLLNPVGPGEDLLKIFDLSVNELVQMGAIDKEYADQQKAGIRENIKKVG